MRKDYWCQPASAVAVLGFTANYSPSQPRGKHGRWTRGAGSSAGLGGKAGRRTSRGALKLGSVAEDITELKFKGAHEHEVVRYKELTSQRTALNKKIKGGSATPEEHAHSKVVKAELDTIRKTIRDRYAAIHGREAEKKITGKTLTRKPKPDKVKPPPPPPPPPKPDLEKVKPKPEKVAPKPPPPPPPVPPPVAGGGPPKPPPASKPPGLYYDTIHKDYPKYTTGRHAAWLKETMDSYEAFGEAKRQKVLAVGEERNRLAASVADAQTKISSLHDKWSAHLAAGETGEAKAVQKEMHKVATQHDRDKKRYQEMTYSQNAIAHKALEVPRDQATVVEIGGISKLAKSNPNLTHQVKMAQEFLNKTVAGKIMDQEGTYSKVTTISVKDIPKGMIQRSYCTGAKVTLSQQERAKVVVHEIGHALEFHNENIHHAALAFLESRAGHEPLQQLNKVIAGSGFDDSERGRKDEFFGKEHSNHDEARRAYYAGKDYGGRATEIISMGIEEMYHNPVAFAKKDPGYFKFISAVMDGHIR